MEGAKEGQACPGRIAGERSGASWGPGNLGLGSSQVQRAKQAAARAGRGVREKERWGGGPFSLSGLRFLELYLLLYLPDPLVSLLPPTSQVSLQATSRVHNDQKTMVETEQDSDA